MKDFWSRLSIRYKIISILVLTILLVTVTILPTIPYLIRDALLRQQRNHLESVKNLAIKLFEDYQSKITNYTKLFSNDREIKDSLFYHAELAGEREHPLRAITRLFTSFDISTIEIGDARGRLVAIAEEPQRQGEDRSQDPQIKGALAGTVTSGLVLTQRGLIIKAAAPISYNENQIIGSITAGMLLDDTLLAKIKQLSDTDLVIVDPSNRVISSTMRQRAGKSGEMIGGALSEGNLSGKLVIRFPLADMHKSVIGTVLIIQEDKLPGIIAKTHLTLVLLLVFISAASVVVLLVVLRKVMQPLVRLREGAKRIGKGEFGFRIEASSKDEIGELAEEFNSMAQGLERLRSMEERLYQTERLAAVGAFAAGIAHEINNPVGNVIGIAKLMLKKPQDAANREDIESIVKDAGRCASIIKDLLAYSRQAPPRKESTSLNGLVESAVRAVAQQADAKRIEIARELRPALQEIFVDPLQIDQVLSNVLLNAVQSIEPPGCITIKTSALDDDRVEISVADTGTGIDDAIRDKIFYPFFTTKAVGEGTGLGLAISYGIVQNHGGELLAENGEGRGSIFRIRLPVGAGHG